MKNFNFENLEKRRPFWKDMLMFMGVSLIIGASAQILLNRSAFAQIAEFKYEKLKTSVIQKFGEAKNVKKIIFNEPLESKIEEKALQKIKKWKKTQFKTENIKPRNQAKNVFKDMAIYPSDNRIYIPRLNKNVPLIDVPNHQNWAELEKNIQKGLQNGVVVHPVSHAPGNFGNFFLTGHSSYYQWDKGRFKDVFALLHEVKIGDSIEVYWEGKKYTYKVKVQEVVKPTEVGILNQPKDKMIMTMMTCTPVGTNTNRLIVTAELTKQE